MSQLFAQKLVQSSNTGLRFYSNNSSIASGGSNMFNLESLFGYGTTGLLYIRGVENNINQTFFTYHWNISIYLPTSVRYVQLQRLNEQDMIIENNYGTVYAYLSNYSASRTTANQSQNSSSSSISDIYFRNGAGAGCQAHWSIIRTG